jgi:hypothetical protein
VQRVKTWQLLIVLVLVGFVAATFLRLNNVGMDQRRASVLLADKEARDGDVLDRMYDLQRYTTSHMNANTGQFDLTEQYKRDVQKILEAAANDTNPNGNVSAKAAEVCDPQFAGWSLAYVHCFIEELNKYPSAPTIDDAAILPNPALYRHSFVSPRWSPDFAGFSLLIFIFIALIIAGRLAHFGFLTLLLKLRKRGIGS